MRTKAEEGERRTAPCHSSLFLNTLKTTSHDDQNSGDLRHVWVTPSDFRKTNAKKKEERPRDGTLAGTKIETQAWTRSV